MGYSWLSSVIPALATSTLIGPNRSTAFLMQELMDSSSEISPQVPKKLESNGREMGRTS